MTPLRMNPYSVLAGRHSRRNGRLHCEPYTQVHSDVQYISLTEVFDRLWMQAVVVRAQVIALAGYTRLLLLLLCILIASVALRRARGAYWHVCSVPTVTQATVPHLLAFRLRADTVAQRARLVLVVYNEHMCQESAGHAKPVMHRVVAPGKRLSECMLSLHSFIRSFARSFLMLANACA